MKKFAILALLISCSASAQTTCDRLSDRAENIIKEISYDSVSGLGDNSAPRETYRQLRVVADYSAMQLTLAQQQAAKCKPYTEPVTGGEYMLDAMKCVKATASNSRTYDEVQQACDRKTWKRGQ